MENVKKTSGEVAAIAAKILSDKNSSEIAKKLAGSTLSQVNKGNETGSEMEDIASKVLRSKKYADMTKALAASILSQSNKKR